MGKIIKDATPKQEREFIQERRKSAFLTASRSPTLWRRNARLHKRAADILYEIAHAANEREMARVIQDFKNTSAKMDRQKLSSYSESRTLDEEVTQDLLDVELLSDYFLLAGYGLECILKGYLLSTNPELVKYGKIKKEEIANHDLELLFKKCGIKLNKLERQIIKIIALHTEWKRYPTPLTSKTIKSPVEPSPTPLDIPGSPFHNRILQNTVNQLFQRGYDLLKRQ